MDEAMIKFQGCSTLEQYMPKKPIKHGIKVWVLGDSTNGYFSRFDIYQLIVVALSFPHIWLVVPLHPLSLLPPT